MGGWGLQPPFFQDITFYKEHWLILFDYLTDNFLAIIENIISTFSCASDLTIVGPYTSLDLIFSSPKLQFRGALSVLR